jgi:hypothetical protein
MHLQTGLTRRTRVRRQNPFQRIPATYVRRAAAHLAGSRLSRASKRALAQGRPVQKPARSSTVSFIACKLFQTHRRQQYDVAPMLPLLIAVMMAHDLMLAAYAIALHIKLLYEVRSAATDTPASRRAAGRPQRRPAPDLHPTRASLAPAAPVSSLRALSSVISRRCCGAELAQGCFASGWLPQPHRSPNNGRERPWE